MVSDSYPPFRPGRVVTRERIGLFCGGGLFCLMLLVPAPAGLGVAGWRTAAVGTLMATWWVTEAIPIPATALLPLVLFPLLDVGSIRLAAAPFANPVIYLFLGGFLLAGAMQRWGLPRRIALRSIVVFGARPRAILAGTMASCAFLSMWVSNTATALMMLPIGLSLVERLPGNEDDPGRRRFATALMLGIAYACSIGGMATLIGTPPNALLKGFMYESYGVTIGFAEWMLVGVPIAMIGLPVTYVFLTRVLFPIQLRELPGGGELVQRELATLGRMSSAERRVAAVFALTAVLWIARPLLETRISGITDEVIAMGSALALFLLPSGTGDGDRLLTWDDARKTPWGVLILFGGGLSLAAGVGRTGLSTWIGASVGGLAHWPLLLLTVVVIVSVILLTELTSNTATAATFLPVLGGVAVGLGRDPALLAVPAALAASGAFMLPVATPPNAIVYGSGSVTIHEMVRAGIGLNLLFTVLIAAATWTLVPLLFGA